MQPRLSHIHQIAITVGDVDIALAFYRDALGLPFLFQPAPTLAFLQAGDVRLMLTTPQGAGAVGANSILYFRVDRRRKMPVTTLLRALAGDMDVAHGSVLCAGAALQGRRRGLRCARGSPRSCRACGPTCPPSDGRRWGGCL